MDYESEEEEEEEERDEGAEREDQRDKEEEENTKDEAAHHFLSDFKREERKRRGEGGEEKAQNVMRVNAVLQSHSAIESYSYDHEQQLWCQVCVCSLERGRRELSEGSLLVLCIDSVTSSIKLFKTLGNNLTNKVYCVTFLC